MDSWAHETLGVRNVVATLGRGVVVRCSRITFYRMVHSDYGLGLPVYLLCSRAASILSSLFPNLLRYPIVIRKTTVAPSVTPNTMPMIKLEQDCFLQIIWPPATTLLTSGSSALVSHHLHHLHHHHYFLPESR